MCARGQAKLVTRRPREPSFCLGSEAPLSRVGQSSPFPAELGTLCPGPCQDGGDAGGEGGAGRCQEQLCEGGECHRRLAKGPNPDASSPKGPASTGVRRNWSPPVHSGLGECKASETERQTRRDELALWLNPVHACGHCRAEEWREQSLCSHGNRPGKAGPELQTARRSTWPRAGKPRSPILPGGWGPKRRGSSLKGNAERSPAASRFQIPPWKPADCPSSHIIRALSWHRLAHTPSPGTRRSQGPGWPPPHPGLGAPPEESLWEP